MILAVDTSLGTAVAIVRDGTVLASLNEPNPLGHAEVIGNLIAQALADAAAQPRDITTVATGMGPGPFTGLRVGIATARAFAIGAGASVFAVPSHSALALGAIQGGQSGAFEVVTDARRREVAVTEFDGLDDAGVPRAVRETYLVKREELVAGGLAQRPTLEFTVLDASDLGIVAERAIAAGRELTSGEPLYLRAPDVATPRFVSPHSGSLNDRGTV